MEESFVIWLTNHWIFLLVAAIVLLIACVAHYSIQGCIDLEDFFIESFGWVTVLIVLIFETIVYVFVYCKWQNWFFWLIAAIVLIVACVAHFFIAECIDIADFFDEGGWITILAVAVISAIVYGFIYWIWWAMLIITVGVAALALIVAGVYAHYENSGYDNEDVDYSEDKKDEETTRYKCPNCGAAISKIYVGGNIVYKCAYCNTTFDKKDLKLVVSIDDRNGKTVEIEIDDFEEEYFEACERMNFRPYNIHSAKQIERRRDKLDRLIQNGEDVYDEDCYDQDEILEDAYDFFIDNEREIKEYFDKYGDEEIKKRYEAYADGDEEDEEDYD